MKRRKKARFPASSLTPVNLETGAYQLSAPDLTEHRTVIRPFPKDEGERACYQYLVAQMQAAPDRPCRTKAEFEKTCRRRFHVTKDSFEYCWREAIKVAGALWDQPGRRPKI
jgi:hypothetical protein